MRLDHLLSKESTVGQPSTSAGQTADSHVDHWLFGLSRRRRLDVSSRGSVPESWLSGHHYSVLKERPPWPLSSGPPAQRAHHLAETPAFFFDAQLLENCIASTSILKIPSYKEPTVDALAPDADEGRGWLRKATGSCRPSAMTRGYPNGETRLGSCPVTPARTHRAGGGHRGN